MFPFPRLQVLEQQVVGGEQAKNKDLKEKHKRRKRYADERRMQLVAALQQVTEDSSDWVLLNVYDSIHEEVRAKSKLLEKMQRRVSSPLMSFSSFSSSVNFLFRLRSCFRSACYEVMLAVPNIPRVSPYMPICTCCYEIPDAAALRAVN